ncbi:non-homologous end-joining DNA ligase [Amycolatopsis umgeniensis]|uniref:DNA ligase (ATP) n=1 Tax=Amycolatopsis umgeniensis TaxID=336628 RepID=A0A841BBU2_9PSEU|nr:non-homologous end-joining DNA ligase [Amycolatopsis umgeniensis]MBB5856042.1 bifunctional non-homologous end joining protein LigD [Amycolatopsis umgeniensis]
MSTVPDAIAPMLATDGDLPTGGWGYEYKWDGYRCCLRVARDGETRLTSRRGLDITATYPDVTGEALDGREAVLDGEIVVLDDQGRPSFPLLQTRHLRTPDASLLERSPVHFFAFDVLLLDGTTLLDEPYAARRELLTSLGGGDRLVIPPGYTDDDISPDQLLEVVRQHGLEGLIAKKLDSRYHPGKRTRQWIKRALWHSQEVVIGGWRPGEGRRSGTLGALLLGAHDESGDLRYVGDVGTGFSDKVLEDLHARLTPLERKTPPFASEVPRERARRVHWVAPELVGEVVHRNWTPDGRLRHTTWRGLRSDKAPEDVKVPLSP